MENIFFCRGEEKWKRRKIFGEGKYFLQRRKMEKETEKKYLEKENKFILRMRRKRMIYFEKEKILVVGEKKNEEGPRNDKQQTNKER